MKSLSPLQAAEIADAVYDYKNITAGEKRRLPTSMVTDFTLNLHDGPIKGQTGILFTRKTTGFAITAKGKDAGLYKGHHILAIRGTDMEFTPDKVTDGFVSVGVSHNRKMAHGGFSRISNAVKYTCCFVAK